MTHLSTIPPAPAPVAEDLPCIRCHYNLRTLPPTGRCPECGEPVALSVARRRHIGGVNLRRMTLGSLLIAALAALQILDVLRVPALAAAALGLPSFLPETAARLCPMLIYILILPFAVGLLTSSRDPKTPQRKLTSWLCTSAALWAVLSVALAACLILKIQSGPGSDFLDAWSDWIFLALGALFAWSIWYLNLAGLIFLRSFFNDRHMKMCAMIVALGLGLAALAPLAQIPWLVPEMDRAGGGFGATDWFSDLSGAETVVQGAVVVANGVQVVVWIMAAVSAWWLGRRRR